MYYAYPSVNTCMEFAFYGAILIAILLGGRK